MRTLLTLALMGLPNCASQIPSEREAWISWCQYPQSDGQTWTRAQCTELQDEFEANQAGL